MSEKSSVDLRIHRLVRLRGEHLPRELASALRADYAPFVSKGADTDAELTVMPFDDAHLPKDAFGRRKSFLQQRFVTEVDREYYAVTLHRGQTDCVLRLTPPHVLYFRPRKGCVSAVLDMLFTGLDMVLHEASDALLCKGAVVVRDGRAAVLTGLSGAGKTSLLLHLMRDGWDYLSDNTFILRDGQALCFRRHLVMHGYHLRSFAHLFDSVPTESGLRSTLRSGLRRILPHLPVVLQQSRKVNRLADPFIRMEPEDLRPDIHVVEQAEVAMWISLVHSSQFGMQPLTRSQMKDRLQAVLDLNHDDYHFFRKQCALHWRQPLCDEEQMLERNLGAGPFFNVCLSQQDAFGPQYEALHGQMQKVLVGEDVRVPEEKRECRTMAAEPATPPPGREERRK